jgi:hypothetical protein
MELPRDVMDIISEYSKPVTHEKWWFGSHTAEAIHNSELWKEYDYDVTGELAHDRDKWTFYHWLEHCNHFYYHRIGLY